VSAIASMVKPTIAAINGYALALARPLAANPRMSVVQAKIALNASQETTLSAGLQFENEAWPSCMLSDAWRAKIERFTTYTIDPVHPSTSLPRSRS
jgi:enoyl-CoA hydratase/carnithine racemase